MSKVTQRVPLIFDVVSAEQDGRRALVSTEKCEDERTNRFPLQNQNPWDKEHTKHYSHKKIPADVTGALSPLWRPEDLLAWDEDKARDAPFFGIAVVALVVRTRVKEKKLLRTPRRQELPRYLLPFAYVQICNDLDTLCIDL